MHSKCVLRNERGQSIVELTLITPLLLAALYVAMDFGILFFTAQYAQNAAREAARVGSILPDCDTGVTTPCVETIPPVKVQFNNCPQGLDEAVVKEACDRLPKLLDEPEVSVTLTGETTSTCMREVEVLVTGTYNVGLYRVMALIGLPTEKTISLTRSAAARFQGQKVTTIGKCS